MQYVKVKHPYIDITYVREHQYPCMHENPCTFFDNHLNLGSVVQLFFVFIQDFKEYYSARNIKQRAWMDNKLNTSHQK